MATEAQLEAVRKVAPEILRTPIDSLVVDHARWGAINFEKARRDLEVMFDTVGELQRLPIQIIPDGPLDAIVSALSQCSSIVTAIRSFELLQSNPSQIRDQYVDNVKGATTQLLAAAAPWLPFLAYREGDVQRNIEAMTLASKNIRATYEEAQHDAARSRTELEKIVQAAREASAVAGVGVFTADFSDQAASLEVEATSWLKRTAWAAGITIAIAMLSLIIKVGNTPSEIAQFLTTKILTLVVLISSTVWCGRVYKATKHQAATNRHRALALKTFQAFTQASDDAATRNAVLLESTRSIFAISPSGYLDGTDAGDSSGTKILEIVKGINGKTD